MKWPYEARKKVRQIHHILFRFLVVAFTIQVLGCHPALKKEAQRTEEALRPVGFFYPSFHDDLDFDSLVLAIRRNLDYLNRLDPQKAFYYGRDTFTCRQVVESQKAFLDLIETTTDLAQLNREIKTNFFLYRAAGRKGNNRVLFTGYYEPTFDATLLPDGLFKYPIYREPDDLVKIDLAPFNEKLRGETIVARVEGKRVLPYYTRRQIDQGKELEGRNLELAWLKDPVDVAFLQIQGSGRLRLRDGRILSVGYRASNGHPYRSIGRYMLDKGLVTADQISMQNIRQYLSQHPEKRDGILYHNPSYVFFEVLDNGPPG